MLSNILIHIKHLRAISISKKNHISPCHCSKQRERERISRIQKTRFQFQISRRARYSPLRFILAFPYIRVYKIEDLIAISSLSFFSLLFFVPFFHSLLPSNAIATIDKDSASMFFLLVIESSSLCVCCS